MKSFKKFIFLIITYFGIILFQYFFKSDSHMSIQQIFNLKYFIYALVTLICFLVTKKLLSFYNKKSEEKFLEEFCNCRMCGKEVKIKNMYWACKFEDGYYTLNDFFNIFPCCSKECCIEFYEEYSPKKIEEAIKDYWCCTELPQNYYKDKHFEPS